MNHFVSNTQFFILNIMNFFFFEAAKTTVQYNNNILNDGG